jgi:modulator of FtsH protease HflK
MLDAAWRRMHWWIAVMTVLYALSGITVIRPDEVGVVLRWGRLVGDTQAAREHGPGLLVAFPRPVDRVVRVKTKYVRELSVKLAPPPEGFGSTLGQYTTEGAASGGFRLADELGGETLDPLTVGYALSGDQNIVHVKLIARYRIRDAAEWAFYGPKSEDIVRSEVCAAAVRSIGEMGVDQVLAEQRKDLIETVTRRTQAGLDAAHSGLELVAIELTDLSPPQALVADFEAVQSAYIGAETEKKKAQAFVEDTLPKAHAFADAEVQRARGDAATAEARARGDVDAFLALEREYRSSPEVVHERLYRDAVEKAVSAAAMQRWVPPPASGHYENLRILVRPQTANLFLDESQPGPADSGQGSGQGRQQP